MRALAALVVLSFALAACDSSGVDPVVPDANPVTSEPGSSEPASVALPLAVGNEWTYRVVQTNYQLGGAPVPPVPSDTTSETVRVTGTVEIEGETWYTLGRTGRAFVFPELVANRDDGLYARGGSAATGYTPAVKRAVYPAPVGTHFGIAYWAGGVEGSPTGFEGDQDVTLKRTDLPFTVGGVEYEGYLFTLAARRFRLGGVEYPADPLARSLNDLLIPDVGYGQLEVSYWRLSPDSTPTVMELGGVVTMTLQSFTLVEDPG
jgi:hypothetical protein